MSAIAIASGGSALTPATGNITLFVSNLGSDSNPGTALLPFATIQHAVSVGLGFDYQSLYQLNISVAAGTYHENVSIAGGILFGLRVDLQANAFLSGDSTTPTNVKIAPNSGTVASVLYQGGGFWQFDGFSLVGENGVNNSSVGMLDINGQALCRLGTMDFNTGTTANYESWITTTSYARIFAAAGSGTGNLTIEGNGAQVFSAIGPSFYSRIGLAGISLIFNSAINLAGSPFFQQLAYSGLNLTGTTFTNVGNVTGGPPFSISNESELEIGADPTTITWPGGAFSPAQLDTTSSIDGLRYVDQFAGAPVDETSIYRGSWQIHKDSNQTTAGLGLNLYVDDAGTVVPLIALTPAPGNLTFFVSTTGSDSNPGTSGSPFATIQHAASVASSFDFKSIYNVQVNVANGTYHESVLLPVLVGSAFNSESAQGLLLGNSATPTNCVINPNNAISTNLLEVAFGANWAVGGFSLKADQSGGAGVPTTRSIVRAGTKARITLQNIDWNVGTSGVHGALASANQDGEIYDSFTTSASWTVQGTAGGFSLFNATVPSYFQIFNGPSITFNSAINLGGNAVFNCDQSGFFIGIGPNAGSVIVFVNPGNITGGVPISALHESAIQLGGTDPTTITWPSGPFVVNSAGTEVIDNSSSLDGFFYGQNVAGALTDQTTIYRGSWVIFKDTTNVRRYLAYDDGGTIYAKQIGRVPNTQTSTPYVLALSDQDGRVEMNNAGANQLTVPANATVAFPIGTEIRVVQVGAGATTIAGAVGVTVDAAGVVGGQWKSVMLYKRGTNEWVQTNV